MYWDYKKYGKIYRRTHDVWDSGLQEVDLRKGFKINVPLKILTIMQSIHNAYPEVEVGLYIKADIDKQNLVVNVHDDFYIPKQEVSSATIEFKEPPPEGFNGVIHKHPLGCTKFSGTDEDYINSNFDVSILFTYPTFSDACVRITDEDRIYKYGGYVKVIYNYEDVIQQLKQKVSKKQWRYLKDQTYEITSVGRFEDDLYDDDIITDF